MSEGTGGKAHSQQSITHSHLEGKQKTQVDDMVSISTSGNWSIQPEKNQEHNCTALGTAFGQSVPVPLALRIVLPRHLQVVEVEVGHHVT